MGEGGLQTGLMMNNPEIRFFDFRFDRDARTVSGVAVRYGDRANIADLFTEEIRPGALDLADVVLTLQHARQMPLARTDGGGLRFSESGEVLSVEATLPQTQLADDALTLIETRVLRGFSLEMHVLEERWSDQNRHRSVLKAKIPRLSLVDTPAYPESLIQDIRSKVETPPRRFVF